MAVLVFADFAALAVLAVLLPLLADEAFAVEDLVDADFVDTDLAGALPAGFLSGFFAPAFLVALLFALLVALLAGAFADFLSAFFAADLLSPDLPAFLPAAGLSLPTSERMNRLTLNPDFSDADFAVVFLLLSVLVVLFELTAISSLSPAAGRTCPANR